MGRPRAAKGQGGRVLILCGLAGLSSPTGFGSHPACCWPAISASAADGTYCARNRFSSPSARSVVNDAGSPSPWPGV